MSQNTAVKLVHAELLRRVELDDLSMIARAAGVPYGWLQQFFYLNIKRPGWQYFTRLAKHLGFSLDDLYAKQ